MLRYKFSTLFTKKYTVLPEIRLFQRFLEQNKGFHFISNLAWHVLPPISVTFFIKEKYQNNYHKFKIFIVIVSIYLYIISR